MPSSGAVPRRATRLPRPTRSAALLLLLAIILELLGRLIKSTGVTIAAAAALGAIFGDAVLIPRLDGLTVTRQVSPRLTAGVAAAVRLLIDAPTTRFGARRAVVLIAEHPALPTAQVVTPQLRPGQRAIADLEITPDTRGFWADGGTVKVEAFSPLGGFVRHHTLSLSEPCWVHPAAASPLRLPDVATGKAMGTSTAQRSGNGTEFYGIREWRSGDASSAIHWRASARRSRLLVMEREQPTHPGLLVIAGPAGDGSSWETAIARAAATTVSALRSGRTVTLVVGDSVTTARSGREVLDWYAALAPSAAPEPIAAQHALRSAGAGSILLWLATTPAPPILLSTARSASIGGIMTVGRP